MANLDKLVDATDAQKRVIKGELLYLRAFSYFNIIQYWGGMPYVSSASTAAEDIKYLPRLSYQQTTDSIAKDFEEAAESLQTDWDDEDYGQLTKGKMPSVLLSLWLMACSERHCCMQEVH